MQEFPIFGIGAEFDDFDFVGDIAALAEAVPVIEPGFGLGFLAEGDEEDVAFFFGADFEFAAELFEVGGAEGMVLFALQDGTCRYLGIEPLKVCMGCRWCFFIEWWC